MAPDEINVQSGLSGDQADWDLAPILAWVVHSGRLGTGLPVFVNELIDRMQAAGAPLWRFYIGLQTIHPQLRAMGVVWRRGEGYSEVARRHGIEKTSAYIGSPVQEVRERRAAVRYRLDTLTQQNHEVLHEVADAGGTDYLALPMPFSRGEWPVVTIATDRPGGFSDADIAKFTTMTEQVAAVIEMHVGYSIATTLLETYLGRETGERIMRGLIRRGDGDQIRAVLWFSDMRNFTGHSESMAPDRVLAMLNEYFEALGGSLKAHGGEILRFIGDAILAIFAVPDAMFLPGACSRAADAALESLERIAEVNRRRADRGEPAIEFGIGLHVGTVTYGNIGTEDRLDFTVIGPAVNRCARLQSLTKEVGVPILGSAEFNENCAHPMQSIGRLELRGVPELQEVFTFPSLKS